MGYEIRSSPKIGYTFKKSPDLLLPEEIEHGLKTKFIGKHVVHYDTAFSTQDIAAEMARGGATEGTLVIAETQENGRGRKGRSWVSFPREEYIFPHFKTKSDAVPGCCKFLLSRRSHD